MLAAGSRAAVYDAECSAEDAEEDAGRYIRRNKLHYRVPLLTGSTSSDAELEGDSREGWAPAERGRDPRGAGMRSPGSLLLHKKAVHTPGNTIRGVCNVTKDEHDSSSTRVLLY